MLTRREFVAKLAAAAACVATAAKLPSVQSPAKCQASQPKPRANVVGFHLDQPYLDATGHALPYLPPAGLRSAAPIQHLNEQQIRSHNPYF